MLRARAAWPGPQLQSVSSTLSTLAPKTFEQRRATPTSRLPAALLHSVCFKADDKMAAWPMLATAAAVG